MTTNHVRLLTGVIVICVIILLIVNIVAIFYATSQTSALEDDLTASCERGNVIRARLNELIEAHPHDPDVLPLPILDCEAVIG